MLCRKRTKGKRKEKKIFKEVQRFKKKKKKETDLSPKLEKKEYHDCLSSFLVVFTIKSPTGAGFCQKGRGVFLQYCFPSQ